MEEQVRSEEQVKKKSGRIRTLRGSYLVTEAGIIILAVLLLISAYFRAGMLIAFLSGLLIISVIAFLWAHFSLARLELAAGASGAEGFPGEYLCVKASLKNNKFLPVFWLKLSAAKEAGDVLVLPQEDGAVRSFLWVMSYQELSWEIKLKAGKRGYWNAESLTAAGGDGFGLTERQREVFFRRPVVFIVYPELVPVTSAPFRKRLQELETVPFGSYEDTTLIKYARSYRCGDNARRINWRQAARTGELEVNIYETQDMRHIALALDAEAFIYLEEVEENREKHLEKRLYEEAFEETVSLLASAALDLLEHDVCCTVILPSGRTTAAGPQQGADILRALAMVRPLKEEGHLPDEADLALRHRDGPVFLFTNEADARIEEWLENWRALSAHVVCRDKKGCTDPAVMLAEEVRL